MRDTADDFSIELTKAMADRVKRRVCYTDGITQDALAAKAGVSTTTINRIVNDKTENIMYDIWRQISIAIGWEFDVQFFGRKLHAGGPDENHQFKIRAENDSDAWNQVEKILNFDIVKKISCEIIRPPKTKEELEEEKKMLVEIFPSNIREYVTFFVQSESAKDLKGEVEILKKMVREMKDPIEKFEKYLEKTSPQNFLMT